jgi:hypothetical protein
MAYVPALRAYLRWWFGASGLLPRLLGWSACGLGAFIALESRDGVATAGGWA